MTFIPAAATREYVFVRTQAELDRIASAAPGTQFRIYPGTYSRSTPIIVPEGCTIKGVGGGKPVITMPDGVNSQVFVLSGDNTRISNVRVQHLGNPSTAAVGFIVYGAVKNIEIDRCDSLGFWHGFQVQGIDAANRAEKIKFVDCYSSSFDMGWYGYDLHFANEVDFLNCTAYECGADGFKISQSCYNTRILGGGATRSGMSTTPGVNGQGIDAYAGGDTLIITDFVARENGVNSAVGLGGGIMVKSSVNSGPVYGYMRRIIVANCQVLGNTKGDGITVFTEPGGGSHRLIQSASVLGNVIDGGDENGVRLGGANISFLGNIIRKNAKHGVLVDSKTFGTTIVGNSFIANSYGASNGYNSLEINGADVLVDDNNFDGQLNDDATDPAGITGGTKWPARHIRVAGSAAANVRITETNRYSGSFSAIPVYFIAGITTTGQIQDRIDNVLPNVSGSYAGPGSWCRRWNAASDADLLWVKPVGSQATDPFNWKPLHLFVAQNILPSDLKAGGVRTPGVNAAVTLAITDRFIKLDSTDAASKPITMTAGQTGQEVTLSMISYASTGNYTAVVAEGTITLDAAKEIAVIWYDGAAWRLKSLYGATIS